MYCAHASKRQPPRGVAWSPSGSQLLFSLPHCLKAYWCNVFAHGRGGGCLSHGRHTHACTRLFLVVPFVDLRHFRFATSGPRGASTHLHVHGWVVEIIAGSSKAHPIITDGDRIQHANVPFPSTFQPLSERWRLLMLQPSKSSGDGDHWSR